MHSLFKRSAITGAGLVLIAAMTSWTGSAAAAPPSDPSAPQVNRVQSGDSGPAIHHDTSRPLRDYQPTNTRKGPDHADVELPTPSAGLADPVVQTTAPAAAAPTVTSFEGIGQGNITINGAPPDPNSAVGPTQVVEVVNTSLAVFNKSTGAFLLGPENTNTLWSGFGGTCQTTNDGDAVVRYDRAANRWVVTQFANVRSTSGPYQECIAVSQTSDATGAWFRYAFQFANFPDYPKLSVWSDAYYITYNMFNPAGTSFLGGEECAYDRAKMLTGAAATQQCFTTSTTFAAPLPADLDSTTAPPAGANNLMVTVGSTATTLAYWKFHVDFTTPANSSLTGPTNLTVASYTLPCGGTGGTCIPQSGTTQQLDTLGDRMMFRSAYRNFGDHESIVLSHSVAAGSATGERWYELRLSGGNPSVFQQSTFAPDATSRWMGSIAMDKAGGIALGYSAASSSLSPAVRVTGRVATDALNTMTQGEATIQSGASQTGGLSRWGDYTSMDVDPSDNCTFWYTDEYLAAAGSFNWHTRIGHFVLPNCLTVGNDFSVSDNPTSGSVVQGSSTTTTVSTTLTSGSAETATLSASGLPSGVTASFSPTSVSTSGGSSTLTLTASASATTGPATVTITATAPSATHTTTYALTVTPPVTNNFSISVSPTSGSVNPGSSTTATVSTAVVSGSAESITLSASGLPTGATASFSPNPITAGASSTMTINTTTSTPAGTSSITITGTAASATHTTAYSLTVNGAGSCTGTNATHVPIPDLSTVNSPITISGCPGNAKSNSTVEVHISHTFIGDLVVSLVAPDGTVYTLQNRTGGSADDINTTYTVNLSSEVANGTWNLRVQDAAAADTGTINSWTLNLNPPPPVTCTGTNPNDVQIPDLSTVNSPITISGCTGNASATSTAEVHIVHTFVGDLIVSLVAPDGTVYTLRNRTGGSADNIDQTFTVNVSSEVRNGTWNLRVQDAAAQDTGFINSWTLTL